MYNMIDEVTDPTGACAVESREEEEEKEEDARDLVPAAGQRRSRALFADISLLTCDI